MMDVTKKIIAGLAVSTMMVASTYAAEVAVPAKLTQQSSTDDSITFSWTPVDGAFGYYIYWGEDSASNFGEFVSDTNYKLTWLDKGKSYKISVTAVNEEDEESEKAPEVTMTTGTTGKTGAVATGANKNAPAKTANQVADTNADFGLARIEILSPSEMNLIFTKNLEEGQDIASQILLETESGEAIELKNVNFGMTPNTVVAALPKELATKTDYRVTILALKDAAGNVIENGIDAVTNFTTPAEFKVGEVVVIDTKENTVEVKTTEELQEEKTKKATEASEKLPELDAAGLDVKTKDGLSKDKTETEDKTKTSETAKEADKLPEAGAEHIFLLLIALLTAGGFAVFSINKNK